MAAKYILAALSVVFLALAAMRLVGARTGGPAHPQARAWLLIGGIFAVVSVYLFWQQS
jgi:hypothetical protein